MRVGISLGLLALSSVAAAAPKPINIKIQGGMLYDVARQLSDQSGCRVTAFGGSQKVDLDLSNATLWDALAKLEIDFGVHSNFSSGGQIALVPKGSPIGTGAGFSAIDPQPRWGKHWRGSAEWAVALLGDRSKTNARLVVLGLTNGTIEKVQVDKASSGTKQITVAAGLPVTMSNCEPATVILDLGAASTKLTLRGHVIVKVPKMIEKRVVVPLDDSVVDLDEGRLRIHVASTAATAGYRKLMVNWDGLGTAIKVGVELVDDTGAPVRAAGRGSGFSSTGQAHEEFTVPTSTKVTAILRIPGSATSAEKIPFKFDNETLDPPTKP